jgi:16S rRNA (guanine966-N2)-methyltransferase
MPRGKGQPTLRIGSGEMAGRKLLPPKGRKTRPMTGYAAKSLFGILREKLGGATVADLYCGTGTLGLEAISNGAARVAFADRDRSAVDRLERNLAECGCGDRAEIWCGNVETQLPHWLAEWGRAVDVAFVDPPFPAVRTWNWQAIADRLFAPLAGGLAAGGAVVLRTPDDVPPPETLGPLRLDRTKEYGQMIVSFFVAG